MAGAFWSFSKDINELAYGSLSKSGQKFGTRSHQTNTCYANNCRLKALHDDMTPPMPRP
jgi:hypothetical protein